MSYDRYAQLWCGDTAHTQAARTQKKNTVAVLLAVCVLKVLSSNGFICNSINIPSVPDYYNTKLRSHCANAVSIKKIIGGGGETALDSNPCM
jgi:hypothetical protein